MIMCYINGLCLCDRCNYLRLIKACGPKSDWRAAFGFNSVQFLIDRSNLGNRALTTLCLPGTLVERSNGFTSPSAPLGVRASYPVPVFRVRALRRDISLPTPASKHGGNETSAALTDPAVVMSLEHSLADI
jgi:hypothetical protein